MDSKQRLATELIALGQVCRTNRVSVKVDAYGVTLNSPVDKVFVATGGFTVHIGFGESIADFVDAVNIVRVDFIQKGFAVINKADNVGLN